MPGLLYVYLFISVYLLVPVILYIFVRISFYLFCTVYVTLLLCVCCTFTLSLLMHSYIVISYYGEVFCLMDVTSGWVGPNVRVIQGEV